MELALITMYKIIEMFLILLIGVIAYKFKVVDTHTNKHLSGLLVNFISPAMIIISYQIDFQIELVTGLIWTIILSTVSYIIAILLSNILIKKGKASSPDIEKISIVYSNCGFIGIPLINGIYGSIGVFYMSAYIAVFNIFIFSHGVYLMQGSTSIKETVKNFFQPATISIAIGISLFLLQIRLPETLGNSLTMVGNMNAPIAMMIAGVTLAQSDLLGAIKRLRVYWISFLRLIAVPLLTLLILPFAPTEEIVNITVLVAAACPVGAMGTIFAIKYNRDSKYASELFAITTLLSLITIPIIIFIGKIYLNIFA